MDALIFIDTNIFLDFYRVRNSEVSLSYLKLIDDNKTIIVTGSQIEMEYKKNRQVVITDSLSKFKNPDWNNLSVPAILSESDAAQSIEELKKEVNVQQGEINNKIKEILTNPSEKDSVFNSLNKLFHSESEYNLHREHRERDKIRDLAVKRFMLGYPPRKKNDTSAGDAINWEWIIHCAKSSNKNIIIVSRDSDFGVHIKKSGSYINDWLKQEFERRVSTNLKIRLTAKLTEAFKSINIPVSKGMIEEENRIIDESQSVSQDDYTDSVTNKIFAILNKK